MKCIKIPANQFGTVSDPNLMVVRRVDDDTAFDLVHSSRRNPLAPNWQYATRTEWKAQGRKWGLGLAGG
jgi:hypothetical protein